MNPFFKTKAFSDNLPLNPTLKQHIRYAAERLTKDDYVSDPNQKMKDMELIRDAVNMAVMYESGVDNKSLPNLGNAFQVGGYQPQGSILRKLIPNDFARHCFITEAYWVARKARWELWTERYRDGYTLVSSAGVTKRDIKIINNVLEEFNIKHLRNRLCDTVSFLGNVCLRNEYKGKTLTKIKPIPMMFLSPIMNIQGTELMGWREIIPGGGINDYLPGEVDHIMTYNARSEVLGSLALGSLETDIEAAMHASIYMNNLMRKGGLLHTVFRLREIKLDGDNEAIDITLAQNLSKWWQKVFGGANHGGGVAFVPGVEGIDTLNKPSELDSPWNNLEDRTAIKVCGQFGVPPERVGIVRTSQYQNKQMVDDSISLSMDNSNYYISSLVDEYLTNLIIRDGLGIDNVSIRASGDFSAITLTQAQVGDFIANLGVDVMSVDEFRVKIMHLEPLGGELGKRFLGEVIREAALAKSEKSESTVTRAIGSAKHLMPEYSYSIAEKVIHRCDEIRYY